VAAELTQVKLVSPIARQRGRRHVIREKKISCLHRLFYSFLFLCVTEVELASPIARQGGTSSYERFGGTKLPSYVCHSRWRRIRQHTSAYVSIRQHTSAYVSIRQHTSAYVSIRQHTSAYVSIRQHSSAFVSIRQHSSAYVSIGAGTHEDCHNLQVSSIRPHTPVA
jgi:hypothetical protein